MALDDLQDIASKKGGLFLTVVVMMGRVIWLCTACGR